jgi:hypothetical protein
MEPNKLDKSACRDLPQIDTALSSQGVLSDLRDLSDDRFPDVLSENGMAKRNFNKLQGHGRTGWRSRNSRKRAIVSPLCPRLLMQLKFRHRDKHL